MTGTWGDASKRVEVRPHGDGRAGVLRREGGVVGCWYVLADDGPVTMHVLHRRPDGGVDGLEFDAAPRKSPADAVYAALWSRAAAPPPAPALFGRIVSAWAVMESDGHLRATDDGALVVAPRPEALRPKGRAPAAHGPSLAEAVRAFLATLDPAALALVSGPDHCLNKDLHALYAGLDATISPGAPLRRCFEAHPAFGRLWADAWQDDPDDFDGVGDVDAFLVATLGRDGPVPRRVVDAIPAMEAAFPASCLATPHYLNLDPMDLAEQVGVLSALPASWFPRDPATWATWMEFWPAVDALAENVERRHVARYMDVGGDWKRWAARLVDTAGGDLVSAAYDVHDMADAFVSEVMGPCLSRVGITADGWDGTVMAHMFLMSGSSMRNTLRVAARWHADLDGMFRVKASLRGPDWPVLRWPAGLPDHREGDLAIRILVDEPGLMAEGGKGPDADGVEGMGHCVGTYGKACHADGTRVASVRRLLPGGSFERLSTFEVSGRAAACGYVEVSQHRGRANGPPPPEAEALVSRYLRAITDGTLAVDEAAFAPAGGGPPADPAGYPSAYDANLAAMLEAWRPHMPARFRAMDVPALSLAMRDAVLRHPDAWWVPDVMRG